MRYHAILGASEHCVAAHPSDMAVALAALDAAVVVRRRRRRAPHPAHRASTGCPATGPSATPPAHGALITAVELPPPPDRRAVGLPQGARPGVVRLRADVGGRRAGGRRRSRQRRRASRWAAWRTARGAPRSPKRPWSARPATEDLPPRRRRRAGAGTASGGQRVKVGLTRGAIVATLLGLRRDGA